MNQLRIKNTKKSKKGKDQPKKKTKGRRKGTIRVEWQKIASNNKMFGNKKSKNLKRCRSSSKMKQFKSWEKNEEKNIRVMFYTKNNLEVLEDEQNLMVMGIPRKYYNAPEAVQA